VQPVSRKVSADSEMELVPEVTLAPTLTLQTKKAHRDRGDPIEIDLQVPTEIKTETRRAKARESRENDPQAKIVQSVLRKAPHRVGRLIGQCVLIG
jgi:hypothetical protein